MRPAVSVQEFRPILQDYVQMHKEQWITKGNWVREKWETKKEPVKEMIDDFTADTPVAVGRCDGELVHQR